LKQAAKLKVQAVLPGSENWPIAAGISQIQRVLDK
jgi:hypothetical protein